MKKGIFLLASISMLMLAGCGESSSGTTAASSSNTGGSTSNTSTPPVTPPVVNNGNVTAKDLGVSLNSSLGVPPQLPSN